MANLLAQGLFISQVVAISLGARTRQPSSLPKPILANVMAFAQSRLPTVASVNHHHKQWLALMKCTHRSTLFLAQALSKLTPAIDYGALEEN